MSPDHAPVRTRNRWFKPFHKEAREREKSGYLRRDHAAAQSAGVPAIPTGKLLRRDLWRRGSECLCFTGSIWGSHRLRDAVCPTTTLGDACLSYLRSFGVGTTKILRGGGRIGIYFLENGAVQRGSKVIYDRDGSSIATIEKGMVDWDRVFEDADWFHWTGITPAISKGLCDVCLEGSSRPRDKGLTVSCDLNYRAKLWKWGKNAGEVMPELVKHCDIAIGNEEDADKVFGIKAPDTDVMRGKWRQKNIFSWPNN